MKSTRSEITKHEGLAAYRSGADQIMRKFAYGKAGRLDRRLGEGAVCDTKHFGQVATRYHKSAKRFLSAVALALLAAVWL
jgi:hypothetical protein